MNDTCESSVPGVYAVGDVNGGPQFTYISLDDFRIVFGALTGNGQYVFDPLFLLHLGLHHKGDRLLLVHQRKFAKACVKG